jgi:membrane protease YdiL (CAAX protease family)
LSSREERPEAVSPGSSRSGPISFIDGLVVLAIFTFSPAAGFAASGGNPDLLWVWEWGRVVLILVYLRIRSQASVSVLFGVHAGWLWILAAVGLAIGLVVLTGAATLGLRFIQGWEDPIYPIWTVFPSLSEVPPMALLSSVVIAPLLEEVVFRSVGYRGLASRIKPWLAAILVSLLFAYLHLVTLDEWVRPTGTFLFSMWAIWALVKTRSLWPAVAAHATFNTLVVAIGVVEFQIIGWGQVLT